ncbi:hypothetical protein ACLMJK_005031 [Lecanora helva]
MESLVGGYLERAVRYLKFVAQSDWSGQFEFRTTGPERGSGNLQLWYAKDGPISHTTASIYTVGYFDGVALVIDSYGGKGGGIRGFMNDGTLDYKNYHSVDSLAFGHCDYSYRNLGRPSKLQIKQEGGVFEVKVDDRLCFASDKIQMPSGYHFGITAASADIADSFEVNKFVLHSAQGVSREEPGRLREQSNNNYGSAQGSPGSPAAPVTDHTRQFDDLNGRLENMAHQFDSLLREVKGLGDKSEGRHQELSRNVMSADRLNAMDQRLEGIEKVVRDYQGQFTSLQSVLRDSHSSLTENLPKHMSDIITTKAPRFGLLVFVFVGVQLILAGSYVIYKRRRANGPKKYL